MKKGELLQESGHKPDGGMAWLMAICCHDGNVFYLGCKCRLWGIFELLS